MRSNKIYILFNALNVTQGIEEKLYLSKKNNNGNSNT